LRPEYSEAHNQLARSLRAAGRRDEAIEAYRTGITAAPEFAPNYCHLAEALLDAGRVLESAAAFRQALRVRPDYAEAFFGLGLALSARGDSADAIEAYKKAIQLRPDFPEAHNNLGNAYKSLGLMAEASDANQAAFSAEPKFAVAHSNFIMMLRYSAQWTPLSILEEMKRWDRMHAEPLRASIRLHPNDRSPDRRLRIGYVSSDFCDHLVTRNLLPLWRHHDHTQFQVFCYASVRRPDRFTERVRGMVGTWRDIREMDDERAAETIRDDRIDILIDLAGHMGETRLPIFARKPAPVQVTFGGYPGGTGLATMDYHLTDPYLDPSGTTESHYVERLIRLERSWWCYDLQDMDVSEPVGPLPASTAGYVTFGCLNNFPKISDHTLAIWKTLLATTGNSRLMMLTPPGTQGPRILSALGAGPDRIQFAQPRPRQAYLRLYHRIDIFLDTLPYNAHTTALDALSMGVPTVTRPGETAVGRAGVSILTHLGLPQLIASNDEEYAQIATQLANDLPQLAELRRTLRQRVQSSPLMDGPGFARDVEAAYRKMWRNWCEEAGRM
jgi:predicted O-linked N-acetylglucosamine transferase (SPINDLY family)